MIKSWLFCGCPVRRATGLSCKQNPSEDRVGARIRIKMAQRGTTARIDLAELERLSAMQCTDEEIAAWFGVTTRTIERRRKVKKFAEVMDRGRAKGRISVRRQQMKLLEAGNSTMGIWLGKNILGQVD